MSLPPNTDLATAPCAKLEPLTPADVRTCTITLHSTAVVLVVSANEGVQVSEGTFAIDLEEPLCMSLL